MCEATVAARGRSNIKMWAVPWKTEPENRFRKGPGILIAIPHKVKKGRVRGSKRVDAQSTFCAQMECSGSHAGDGAVPALLAAGRMRRRQRSSQPIEWNFFNFSGHGAIDTNCTGCNATNSSGASVEQFTATLASGGAATVTWKVSGGDANSGAGTITASGQYTPPSYLTADQFPLP